jgi:hypothetical protein
VIPPPAAGVVVETDVEKLVGDDEATLRFVQSSGRVEIDLLGMRIDRGDGDVHPAAERRILEDSERRGERTQQRVAADEPGARTHGSGIRSRSAPRWS